MRVTIIGTGYVGLVTGTCLADIGHDVTCVDINTERVRELNAGRIPIYEPGLNDIVAANVAAGRLKFVSDCHATVPSADIVFLAVGTPQGQDVSADLSAIWSVVDSVSECVTSRTLVVTKSTVPVGTNRAIRARFGELLGDGAPCVASNPEFLREGSALQDFMHPDRVVVGVEDDSASASLRELYEPLLKKEVPFLSMGFESAEMTKYAANCFLATKISFINEMANLCDAVSADIHDVREGMGTDQRIGFAFLNPGVGYGGSCFPKDVRALASVAEAHGAPSVMLRTADAVNTAQKDVLFQKLSAHFDGRLQDRRIGIWGLAFKPGTDDIREASALKLIDQLLEAGASVCAHDPAAMDNVRAVYRDRIDLVDGPLDVPVAADALVLVTEWDDYRQPDFAHLARLMQSPAIFDGRNTYSPEVVRSFGITYAGIGRR